MLTYSGGEHDVLKLWDRILECFGLQRIAPVPKPANIEQSLTGALVVSLKCRGLPDKSRRFEWAGFVRNFIDTDKCGRMVVVEIMMRDSLGHFHEQDNMVTIPISSPMLQKAVPGLWVYFE